MHDIPEEAVKAAMDEIHAAGYKPDENDFLSMRSAIEVALSFLTPAARRPCTCHPDDNPPVPCAGKYALSDCQPSAAPHLAAVQVKKLEWVATGQTGFLETEYYAVAGSLMHTVHPLKEVDGAFYEHYSIHRDWNDREIWRVTYYVGNNGLSGISKACKSLEDAKSAAQADYEARILSALEPSAARELALEEAARAAENAVLEYNLSECAGLADWAAFEAGQESGLAHAATAIRALSSPDHADAGKVEGDGIERAKFYHHQWPMERLLEARRGGLVDHSGGEAWRYEYSHKDEHGKYDILYRPVKNSTIPARLPSAPSEGAE